MSIAATIARALLVAVLAISACTPGHASSDMDTLAIVGFAVPEAANEAIATEWTRADTGRDVRITTSYGASGEQSRAVAAGLEADYVHFSVPGDVTRLVDAGLVDPAWDTGPTHGIVSSSIVVFAVRPGNPLDIQTWDDLVRPGVEIVTPNPASSGSARWNALAAYGQVTAGGGSEQDARDYLDAFFGNVVALPGSGRDATTAFLGGTGDVLMAYENEAILARQDGQPLDYVVPATTLRIDNPGAVLIGASPVADAWLEFVLGPVGQQQFARAGFRPVAEPAPVGPVEGAADPYRPYPDPDRLLTVEQDIGPWDEVDERFFGDDGIVTTAIAAASVHRSGS